MWTGQSQAASLIVIEVKQEIIVNMETAWIYRVSLSIDEFDDINIVTVLQLFFRTLCVFSFLGSELPEHFQTEEIVAWIILFISMSYAILDDHDFLVFNLLVEVITSDRIQYPVKCLL